MKVEVITIGTELLVSEILDTNTSYIINSLREVHAQLTCKVTVGDDIQMIVSVLQTALQRADVVITTGGLGTGDDDFTHQALAEFTQITRTDFQHRLEEAIVLGNKNGRSGLLLETPRQVIISLPGNRREMAYLLETEVMPYLRKRLDVPLKSDWTLLRTVGVMESSLKQELSDLTIGAAHRISFDSFAGQTNIRIWAEGDTDEAVQQALDRLRLLIMTRLGDHVYGGEQAKLEEVVLHSLVKNNLRLAAAECYTSGMLYRSLGRITEAQMALQLVPTNTWEELAAYLDLSRLTQDNLTQWCRTAAEKLMKETDSDLGLFVYSNVTQGGVQIIVTLASAYGVSVTQRSFGGHPENIDHWALTLGLAHLRRWLMVHHP